LSEDVLNPVSIERRDAIALVSMDNAKTRNALSPEMLQGLATAFETLMQERECRAIVLTGANSTFCSGGDVSRMEKDRPILVTRAYIGLAHRIVRAMVNGPKPVVAAVEGAAIGAGMSLAAASDFVVSSSKARFCAAFAKVGLAPDTGLYWSLQQRVGIARAKQLIMTAKLIDCTEAASLGLVDQVCDEGKALEQAIQLATELAEAAPLSVAVTKAVYADGVLTLEEAFRAERDHHPYLVRSEDHLSAVAAFKEKKKAVFSGN